MSKTILTLCVLLFAFAVLLGMPIALIWALNTLFPVLAIPYAIETWLAAFIIPAAFKTELSFYKKKV